MSERLHQNKMTSGEAEREALKIHDEEQFEEEEDVASAHLEDLMGRRKNLAQLAYEVDLDEKALTGRTPEQIETQTGLSVDKLFPPKKEILYDGSFVLGTTLVLEKER